MPSPVSRNLLLIVVAALLVALYAAGGALQAASLFTGIKALRNWSLWSSLTIASTTIALVGLILLRDLSSGTPSWLNWSLCALLAITAVAALFRLTNLLLAVDACLDSGGSFNYVLRSCDQATNHPFIPLHTSAGTEITAALCCGAASAWFGRRARQRQARSAARAA